MSKTLNIDGYGVIEYQDDISFGDISQIMEACVDISDIQKPNVDANLYIFAVLQRVIIKAPFNHSDINEIKKVDSRTMSKIIAGVMKDFPLKNYVDNWMISLVGMTLADSETISTSSLLSTAAGTNVRLTPNP